MTTGDRTVIFQGPGTFWMTGRDVGTNNGLTGCKGATIIFKGAPTINALATSGTDRGLFAFQATDDATTAGTGVHLFTDTKSDDNAAWATLNGNLEVESLVLFDGQANKKHNCVGGSITRVYGVDAIKHAFNLRPGGTIRKWYYTSDTSDSGGDAVHTLAGVRCPSVIIEDGTLGAMPNAVNGRQIKIGDMGTCLIRNVRFSGDAINATNKWTLNFSANNGRVIIQNCDLPGGITHTASPGVLSCEEMIIEDTRLGEGTATPAMNGGLGLDRLHADIACTSVIYRRVNFDGIDRFCFQPRTNYQDMVETLVSEDCTYRSYNSSALNSPNGRPMLTFNLSATTFYVRGTNTLTGVAPNGLISSSNSTIAAAWTAGTDTSFRKTSMDIYSLN